MSKQIKYKKIKIDDSNGESQERLWHQESTLVFESVNNKVVIGRFDGNEYIDLDEMAISLCNTYNFKYDSSYLEVIEDKVESKDTDIIYNVITIEYKNKKYNLHKNTDFVIHKYKVIGKYIKNDDVEPIIYKLSPSDIENVKKLGLEVDLEYLNEINNNNTLNTFKNMFMENINNLLKYYDNEIQTRDENITIQENEILKLNNEIIRLNDELNTSKSEIVSLSNQLSRLNAKLNEIKDTFFKI